MRCPSCLAAIALAGLVDGGLTGAAVNLPNVAVFIPTVDQVQPNSLTTGKNTLADYASFEGL